MYCATRRGASLASGRHRGSGGPGRTRGRDQGARRTGRTRGRG